MLQEMRACWSFFLNPEPDVMLRMVQPGMEISMLFWLVVLALGDFWIGTCIGSLEAMGAITPFARDWETSAQDPFQRLWSQPFTFTLFPMVDEVSYRLSLLYPSAGACSLLLSLPTSLIDNRNAAMAFTRLGIAGTVLFSFRKSPGNIWCRWWASHFQNHFARHFGVILHLSSIAFAGAECSRLGPDVLVFSSTLLKGYVLTWVCISRGWWSSVILHGFANLCSDSIAWLYKDIFGIGLHYMMLLTTMILLVVLIFSMLPPEFVAALRYFMNSMFVCIFAAA